MLGSMCLACLEKRMQKKTDFIISLHAERQGQGSDLRINLTHGVGHRLRPNSSCTQAFAIGFDDVL